MKIPLPHTNKDIAVTEDEEENVLLCHIVKVSAVLVREEQVGFPEAFEHLGVYCEGVGLEVLG